MRWEVGKQQVKLKRANGRFNETPKILFQQAWLTVVGKYLIKWPHTGLKHHVGVEQKGAKKRLWITCQLSNDPNKQQIYMQGILQHVLQLWQHYADKRSCKKRRNQCFCFHRRKIPRSKKQAFQGNFDHHNQPNQNFHILIKASREKNQTICEQTNLT